MDGDDALFYGSHPYMATTLLWQVPAVEWWDLPLLRDGAYGPSFGELEAANILSDAVTHYIEHPIPIA